MSQDTSDTAYTVAFGPDGFLMVYNPKRGGWEMPGGHIKSDESREEGARREFREEAGYDVEIVDVLDLGSCRAFAGIVKSKCQTSPEMRSSFFTEIPDRLSFDREEYERVVPWAKSVVSGRGI